MALLKKSKRKEMTRDDAQTELSRIQQEISAELSIRGSSGKPKNPGKFREMKRLRATLLEILSSKKEKSSEPSASAAKVEAKKTKSVPGKKTPAAPGLTHVY